MPGTVYLVKIMTRETGSSREQPIDVVLLNAHVVKLSSK